MRIAHRASKTNPLLPALFSFAICLLAFALILGAHPAPGPRSDASALAARHMHLGRDEVALLDAGDLIAERGYFPAELMPRNQRGMNAVLRPAVPVVNVQVGAAN